MFISPAFAEEVSGAAMATGAGNPMMSMLPILLIVLVFYFLVMRPQTKRFQEHRKMVDGLQKGNKVVTGGGLIATVVKVQGEDEVVLKLADGVEVTAVRSTIMSMRTSEQKK